MNTVVMREARQIRGRRLGHKRNNCETAVCGLQKATTIASFSTDSEADSGSLGYWDNRRGSCNFSIGDNLWINSVAAGKRSQALLTILYCSTDRLCRCGAIAKNLSHSASIHSLENNAQPNHEIKHIAIEFVGASQKLITDPLYWH